MWFHWNSFCFFLRNPAYLGRQVDAFRSASACIFLVLHKQAIPLHSSKYLEGCLEPSRKLDFWANRGLFPSSGELPSSSTWWHSYKWKKNKESSVSTWAADPLGDEPPHEVGTVFTPVRAPECVDLWSKKKKSVRKFSRFGADGLSYVTNAWWSQDTKALVAVSIPRWACSLQGGRVENGPERTEMCFDLWTSYMDLPCPGPESERNEEKQ